MDFLHTKIEDIILYGNSFQNTIFWIKILMVIQKYKTNFKTYMVYIKLKTVVKKSENIATPHVCSIIVSYVVHIQF